jgi:hypothetical protein
MKKLAFQLDFTNTGTSLPQRQTDKVGYSAVVIILFVILLMPLKYTKFFTIAA